MTCQWTTEMGNHLKLNCDGEAIGRIMWNIENQPRVLDVCTFHERALREALDIMRVSHGEIGLKAS